jgi:putative metallohydrolase (TIGR04338 family)
VGQEWGVALNLSQLSQKPLKVLLSSEAAGQIRYLAAQNHLPLNDLASVAVLTGLEDPKAFMANFAVWLDEYRDKACKGVYAAEDALQEAGPRFKRLKDVQSYVDGVCASQWWQQRFELRSVEVRGSPQKGVAYADKKRIHLPYWGRKPIVVLHELAHLVQPEETKAHGPEYVRLYCDLVREFMGQEVFSSLLAGLRSRKVRIGRSERVYGLLAAGA